MQDWRTSKVRKQGRGDSIKQVSTQPPMDNFFQSVHYVIDSNVFDTKASNSMRVTWAATSKAKIAFLATLCMYQWSGQNQVAKLYKFLLGKRRQKGAFDQRVFLYAFWLATDVVNIYPWTSTVKDAIT